MTSFDEIHRQLLPTLARAERMRLRYLLCKYACLLPIQLVLLFFVTFLAAAILAHDRLNAFMIHYGGHHAGYIIMGLMALTTIAAFPYALLHWRMVSLSSEIVESLGKAVLPNFAYARSARVSARTIAASRLFPSAREQDTHALAAGVGSFQGAMGETALTISDISFSSELTQRITGALMYVPLLSLFAVSYLYLRPWFTRRNVEDLHSFQGLFVQADFNKEVHGHIVLLPDSVERALGFMAPALQRLDFTRDELVLFEDPAFEREFAVFSTNPQEARYAISPALVHRLVALKNKWGRPVMFAMHGKRLFMAVRESRGALKLRLTSNLTKERPLRELYDTLRFCAEIVDDLNLNCRIWNIVGNGVPQKTASLKADAAFLGKPQPKR